MSDASPTSRPPRPSPADRPDITLPNGKVLTPRAKRADELKLSEKTFARKVKETFYISNTAYVDRDASTLDVVGDARIRNAPPPRRASGRRA
jgi:hypothetical protein